MARLQHDWGRFLPPFGNLGIPREFAKPFAGQVICVAGAGGYLGSALVKALVSSNPRLLLLLDSSEFGLFEIQRYLETAHPTIPSESILGSVGDSRALDDAFTRVRPTIVFHAAAFKHVGLLEQNPFAAVENNALGSYTLAQAALRHGVSKLVLVSTDKAVHPHSVMGVSKRIAEIVTLSMSTSLFRTGAVRLANVIGSTGSVVPIFLECIEKGQPICVSHAEATRYFLSRDQAVTAILAAGAIDCEGKLLLPQLSDPVSIAELAQFLLTSKPSASRICFTGLRPGEKMTEDLIGRQESRAEAIDRPLTAWNTRRLSISDCCQIVQRLSRCVANRDRTDLVETLLAIVPDYIPSHLMREAAPVLS
jgi:FlaA1/EpsC-like NDP-sugar epimerase